MIFPCGWPKSYFAFPNSYGHDELVSCIAQEASPPFKWPTTLVASKRALQLWAATENPFKLSQKFLPPAELLRIGPQISAQFSTSLRSAVTLTSKGWIVLYSFQESSQKLINRPDAVGPIKDATYIKIETQATIQLFANCVGNCLICYRRESQILIGTADGMLQSYEWKGMIEELEMHSNFEFVEDVHPDWFLGTVDPLSSDWTPQSSAHSFHFPTDAVTQSVAKLSRGSIIDLDCSEHLQRLAITFEDGSTGLCHTEDIPFSELHINQWIYPAISSTSSEASESKVTCVRIGSHAHLAAIGCTDGAVLLYKLSTSMDGSFRKLTLQDWGHGPEITGPVEAICWNQDCSAFAVGFKHRGIVVWTPSGCRLMCSLPQTPLKSASSNFASELDPLSNPPSKLSLSSGHEGEMPTLEWGISVISWGIDGYRLWIGQKGRAKEIWEVKFVRSFCGRHRISQQPIESSKEAYSCSDSIDLREHYLLLGDNRILLISEVHSSTSSTSGSDPEIFARSGGSQLTVRHVLAPQEYISENWPIKLAAVSADGSEICLAGTHGLSIFNRTTEKWKLFGDVSQEKSLSALLLSWMNQIVLVCAEHGPEKAKLLFLPSFHLDFGSMLLSHELPFRPIALDCLDHFILVASEPLNVILFECEVHGPLNRSSKAHVSLTAVRELSLFTLESPLLTIALNKTPGLPEKIPDQCVLLRWGGTMTLLDLEKGVEQFLAHDIECFWLSDVARIHETIIDEIPYTLPSSMSVGSTPTSRRKQTVNLVEMPWWAYGVRGMELWFPSSLAEPLSPRRVPASGQMLIAQLDPELEFDREVYPIGISLADAAIIGVSQRLIRPTPSIELPTSAVALPCFSLVPDTQPVLPCLLRRLLQRGAMQEARLLAKKHQKLGLHFSKSLEWLLFTALEIEPSSSSSQSKSRSLTKNTDDETQNAESMLSLATALVKEFPQYPDVVVSVARKTDTQLWPMLFDVVGRPSEILDILLTQGAPHSAACLLVVVDKMEGSVLARALSLQVLQGALTNGDYDLVAELMRYAVSQSDLDLIFTKDEEQTADTVPKQQNSSSSWWSWIWGSETSDSGSRDNRPVVLSGVSFEATKTIHDHVCFLLEFGRLKPLASLAKSLSCLGGGLPALLSYRAERASKVKELTKEMMLYALATVKTEMTGPSFQNDADLLLETCQHAHSLSWSFALALFLRHIPVIVSFKIKHPDLWDQVYHELSKMQGYERFLEVIEEVQQSSNVYTD